MPRRPAVICLHILDGNEPLTDLMCSVLAARGIPAISFKLPYYGSRGTAKGPEALADNPKLFVGAIVQAGDDIQRTIDLLASRPEVDPQRIGITGISMGGIIAATAAGGEPRHPSRGTDPRRRRPAGDHPPCPRNPPPGRHARPPAAAANAERSRRRSPPAIRCDSPPDSRKLAKDGRVLMINAAEDEVIPRACTEKLAKAIGIGRPSSCGLRAGALHGDGRTCRGAADDGRFLRPRPAAGHSAAARSGGNEADAAGAICGPCRSRR